MLAINTKPTPTPTAIKPTLVQNLLCPFPEEVFICSGDNFCSNSLTGSLRC